MEKRQADSQHGLTKILHGVTATTNARLELINGASSTLCICDEAFGTVALVQADVVKNAIKKASEKRGVRVRFITEIVQENLQSCKELMEYVELRHVEGVKGNYAVSESQYYAFAPLKEARLPTETILSSALPIVEQNQYVFDVLWNRSEAALDRIRELEEGITPIATRIISDKETILQTVLSFVQKAAAPKNDPLASFIFGSTDKKLPENYETNLVYARRLKRENPSLRIHIITDVQKENLEYVKKQIELGIDIRHIERNKVTFAVSKDGYIASSSDVVSSFNFENIPNEIIWSNNPDVISQAIQMFEMMWETAIPAGQRLVQLEQGIEDLGETKVVRTIEESSALSKDIMDQTQKEILIILGSEQAVLRDVEKYKALVNQSRRKNLRVRILAPFDRKSESGVVFHDLPWRQVPPMNVGLEIYDRGSMIVTQYANSESVQAPDTFVSNIFTTNKQTIAGIVSIFDALWNVTELKEREIAAREREARSRRQAQLLQDILTHDIRNYNQVSRLTAELIKEESGGSRSLEVLADSLLASIDGSTNLVDRAKSLGRIVSEEKPILHTMNVTYAIDSSLELVKSAFPRKQVKLEILNEIEGARVDRIEVLADDLLNEVFSNLFSNSVKYTTNDSVNISIQISSGGMDADGRQMVRILVSDEGPGIHEDIRENLFNRYLIGAKGSGLGLSIVHALVVDRYKGSVGISNRKDKRGTTVELLLPAKSNKV